MRSAIRLLVAELHYVGAATPERLEPLRTAIVAIDSFSDNPFAATEFITSIQARLREFEEFGEAVAAIGRSHPFFWQRVYPMAGVELQTRRATLFESLRDRLRSRAIKRPPESLDSHKTYDYANGRYKID